MKVSGRDISLIGNITLPKKGVIAITRADIPVIYTTLAKVAERLRG
ncbi:MAG TPA: hypothetical protein PLN56_02475 [Methanoregulaceae archaeon]|nr:MAG: hypothetical protein IPI71_07865 [Methanolinea sp.]HON82269.1 hypothetical protein [Methanoregulaceae archaeon]HPD09851.1 hypothetical protein [Methanoregulaceae archaeon]HRT14958.1 hypothetical protein [Methanoregulaceae archaeon]HRU30427.1 hypothetical protein [Methanoregulaceae archaeon]